MFMWFFGFGMGPGNKLSPAKVTVFLKKQGSPQAVFKTNSDSSVLDHQFFTSWCTPE